MITDWDDAYANGVYVEDVDDIVAAWAVDGAAFRDQMSADGRAELNVPYGKHPRQVMDIFHPEGTPKGLVVFVHGGYWLSRDKNLWSQLAAGANALGWAVAMPGYILCPEVRIADITQQIATAIDFAATRFDGPIHLTGHSAGGHLAARMGCIDIDLACMARVDRIVAISGVHDIRPMLRTEMNADFKMDMAGASAESPALLTPRSGFDLTCWVGADERPEFVRQNALLANVWTGFGMNITCVEEPALNHFTVVNSLVEPDSALTRALIG
ncbi:alpha/beta hydrolase [Rhodobacterales bacterium 52_120_T64]|nr:alpha/beta hydrolase [Rhodobacterales bacterium 52_120_T64]